MSESEEKMKTQKFHYLGDYLARIPKSTYVSWQFVPQMPRFRGVEDFFGKRDNCRHRLTKG